jgi:competence protein ComEC
MVAGALAGRAMGRGVRPWNLLGGAALAVALLSPWEVRGLSFGLSFSAVAGILWVAPLVLRWVPPDLPWPLNWAAGSVAVTLGATAGTLPLVAWVFQEVAWTSPLANLVAVPLVGGIAVPAALMGVAGIPGATVVADSAVSAALAWLRFMDGPVAHPAVGPVGAGLLVLAILALRRPSLSLAFVAAACLQLRPAALLTVTFLAVGQGDAALIELPTGRRILVDGGPPSARVLHWLRRQGIAHLDEVVLTHPHPDHGGGLLPVIEGLSIGGLRVPRLPLADEHDFVALWMAARTRGIPVLGPHEPTLDGVEILHPSPSFLARVDGLNETSVVMRVQHLETVLLLTGDIEEQGEAALLMAGIGPVDWIKVPHHGSLTSSSPDLLAALRPRIAVASSGVENRYRHPRPEIVSRYLRIGARFLRTDSLGTVQLQSDGHQQSWRCWQPGRGWSRWSILGQGGPLDTIMFQSSRWTAGNILFPDRMRLEGNHVIYEKNGLIKRDKETIRFEQISSVSVRRGWFFALLVLESTGGTRPVVLNGLWAGDAEAARLALSARIEDKQASLEDRVLGLLEEQTDLLRRIAAAVEGGGGPPA